MHNNLQQSLKDNKTLVMGILNITPDSFSDGGLFIDKNTALRHAKEMVAQGADIIDIGGESTRPGAQPVSTEKELERVIPIIEHLGQEQNIIISVDTSKPEVMQAAIEAGASLINDVNALRASGAIECCAQTKVMICLMHMQGKPRMMQQQPHYDNVVLEVMDYLEARVNQCLAAGISRERLILDPGFGFGKTLEHNLSLLKHLHRFNRLELPLLVGISRKSMLGSLLGEAPVEKRLYASLAAAVIAALQGTRILRVHDVKATVEALRIVQAVQQHNSQT